MAFKSQSLDFYRTDSKTILSIVFASLHYIIISKPFSYLSDKAARKKLLKKDGLSRLSADLAFWLTRTKSMQSKDGLEICRIALQREALLKIYKYHDPNRSGISNLRQFSKLEVQNGSNTAKMWVFEIRKNQLSSKLSVHIKYTLKWWETIMMPFPDLLLKW